MKVGIITLCYNEEETLGAVLNNWHGKVYKHVVLHTDKPWHGQELPHDKSEEIARRFNADFIRLPWKNEHEQRNWGLAYLHDYDYVLQIDADELMTEADQKILLDTLGHGVDPEEPYEHFDAYRCHLTTYFKTPDWILDPPDMHKPIVAINPKKRLFVDCRIPSTLYQHLLPIQIHHVTYLRNDLRLWHKLQQFEHYDQIKPDWYKEVWKKWEPGMTDVRAYGHEKSGTIRQRMPEELLDLLGTTSRISQKGGNV